jgi:type III restriction enzyme
VQRLYESRAQQWTPLNAVQVLLGPPPSKDLASYERALTERLSGLPHLVVMNDEAHHVHDEGLAWSKSLLALHQSLPHGLALWLDFSATPRDHLGHSFPWVLSDSPLAQAVEDRIVKAPLIVTKEDDPRYPGGDPDSITRDNLTQKYAFWLHAAVERWREHSRAYGPLGISPVLFIMVEKNAYADRIGEYLVKSPDIGLKPSEVLVIHTDNTGEVTKGKLERAREAARDVDNPKSRVKAIVSVMMLREGWDVRNVSVVLGLRPFTARAEILPEQVIGRGLRLMRGVSPDRTQTLEVLGTQNLLNVLREALEAEGVGVATTKSDPPLPVSITPVRERMRYDIAIPLTKPVLRHNVLRLSQVDPFMLGPIWDDSSSLEEPLELRLRMDFATIGAEVHQVDIGSGTLPMPQELLASITRKVAMLAGLSGQFAELYPIVRSYVTNRCFGGVVDVDSPSIRSHLHAYFVQEAIARRLAREISRLTVETRPLAFEKAAFRLSQTRPFQWRRNLPPLVCSKTIFNYVATYNDYERRFAEFLDRAADVDRFASLGTTEQGDSATTFRVDYLKPSGAIGFYHPDFVAVQRDGEDEVNWIVETKGRVWESTTAKDTAITHWCRQVEGLTGARWRFMRVNQARFDSLTPTSLADLVPVFVAA